MFSSVVTAALLAGGCGGSAVSGSLAGTILNIGESDFQITGPDHVKAGKVILRVSNSGPDQHELIVVRSNDPRLSMRSDGLTVNEEALKREEPGALEPGQPEQVRELSLNLTPGRYVFFCNMEGHYLGGMHHEVLVSQ